ncbi:MAG: sigma-70 family RNA polymerase sigma factor [Dehalococcoidia bacterium]|nr:sigma-70 family RNA polymerase sigma factor [Dehalococcoidia bacterium]
MFHSTSFVPLQEGCISSDQMVEHEGLVRWVVRQQWLGELSFVDALHEGRIGLWRALRGYDPRRGTAFSTYAVVAISRAVWQAVAVSRQASLSHGASPLIFAADSDDLVEMVDKTQLSAVILKAVDQLSPRLRQVVVAHHGLDGGLPQTFAAIGQTLGVSKQRVHQLHVTALLWLAHPAHFLPLRRLLGRHSRSDYQEALAHQRRVSHHHHNQGRGRARR